MTDKSEQRIFSYLRKSTKKNEQESSIASQKAHVQSMAKKLWIDLNRIEYFIDSGKSGFRWSEYKDSKSESIVRKREWYSSMISEIRILKKPCKILSWAVSRIARDTKESGAIYNLLWNNKKGEKKIESVHFLDGTIWNEYTTETSIANQIWKEEESSREKSIWKAERVNQSLSVWLYPNEFKVPKWLQNMWVGVKEGWIAWWKLKEMEEMSFIRKAFEMKVEWASNKKIYAYLQRKGISVYIGKIYETIFGNTVYNWYYKDKKTGEMFDLKYTSWKKPISNTLFIKAQEAINRKSGKYWDKQKYDLLANLLRTSTGRRFSVYTPKNRKAKQYQNATEKVYISQNKVFEGFEEVLNRIYFIQYEALVSSMFMIEERERDIEDLEKKLINVKIDDEKNDLQKLIKDRKKFLEIALNEKDLLLSISYEDFLKSDKKEYVSKNFYVDQPSFFSEIEWFTVLQDLKPRLTGFFPDEYMKSVLIIDNANKKMNRALKEIILKNGNEELLEQEEENKADIEELKKEKLAIENKIKIIKKNALIMWGIERGEFEEIIKEFVDRKNLIDEDIKDLQNNSITEQDLDRFVEAVQNIFEHVSNMHNKGIEGVSEEDMLHLIKLTTFELKIRPSNKLDIGLFEGLKNVFYWIGTPEMLVGKNLWNYWIL